MTPAPPMKTLAVEVTTEQTTIVYVRAPAQWDAADMQRALTPAVLQEAIDTGRPMWHQTGELTATYLTQAPVRARPDYQFSHETPQRIAA